MIRYHDKWMNFLSTAKWMNFLSIADYWLQSIVSSGLWSALFKTLNFILILFSSTTRGWDVTHFELWGDNSVSKGRNQGVGGHDQRFKQASYSVQSSVPAQMCSTRQVTTNCTWEWFSYSLFCKICCNMATHVLVELFWDVLMVDKKLLQ